MKRIIITMIMVCSFTSLISQNSLLVKGNFILEIKNNILYTEFINEETGEYLEQRLLIMNLDTKGKDTLIKNTFFIDVEKFSNNEIIMTDGNTISIYNINSKEITNVYSQFENDLTILDVMAYEKDIYFFVRDYNNYKVLFYKLLPNNKVSLLHSFKYAELESPGLKTSLDKYISYILVNGDLYSFNLKSKTINKLTDEYVFTFNLMNDTIFYISNVEDITSLKSISKDNLKQDIVVKDFMFNHPDYFFIINNSLYIRNINGNHIITNQELVPITKIPLMKNDRYLISFIKDNYFEITW